MTRTSHRPLATLALVAAILTYVGCSSKSGTSPDPLASPGDGAKKSAALAPPKSDPGGKLFADWPTPAGALLISGEQDGYLEPCGCTAGQLGGLRRRYDLIERLRKQQKWPLALIDLGSLIKDPAVDRGGPEQVKAKFEIALKALVMMKYTALALSAEDLKNGVQDVIAQFLNLGDEPKVVVANVTPATGEGKIVKSLKTSVGPVKVGITAVIDPEALVKLADASKDVLLPIVIPPEQALPDVLADLKKDTQTQVLMVQGPIEMARKLAKEFPDFDIVVATSQFDPAEDAERLNDGKTLLVTVGKKGKYVGVVGLFLDPKQKYRFQRVTLLDRYTGAAEPIRKLIEEELQEMLKDRAVVENFPRRDFVGGADGSTFVGAEACKSCHPGSYEKWASSKHFQAFDDIVDDPKGKRSDHQFDAECISCHTTGFEYNSGWRSLEKTPYLAGNQCENCHGPSSKHVADPTNEAYRKVIARTAASADKNGLCIRCHDEDNSPHYHFADYWKQIDHKGLDKYDDPKVRQGITPKAAVPKAK